MLVGAVLLYLRLSAQLVSLVNQSSGTIIIREIKTTLYSKPLFYVVKLNEHDCSTSTLYKY